MNVSYFEIAGCSHRDERDIIEAYFWDGFSYQTIVLFLKEYHNIGMTFRTLRRRLKDYGLSRRSQPSPVVSVWQAIHCELQGPGNSLLYVRFERLISFGYFGT